MASAQVWGYSLASVIIVSLVSLVGLIALSMRTEKLKQIVLYLVSFAAGALFGDVFLHLIPEIAESGFAISASIYILSGILFSFVVEKFVHWRHCHHPTTNEHHHHFAIMNLVGDAVHNFIDGLIIAGSYLVSIPLGIATTLTVFFHEIPQEIGEFGVLIHGGFTKSRALMFNFLTALTAVLGAVIALAISSRVEGMTEFLIPFAAGNFIYIAGADIIPELHKEEFEIKKSLAQLFALILGIAVMYLLIFLE